jgi:hypothetical protein
MGTGDEVAARPWWRAVMLRAASFGPLWFGAGAFVLGWLGQRILMPGQDTAANPDFNLAKLFYIVAVGALFYGWWGTYADQSLLAHESDASEDARVRPRNRADRLRLGSVAAALVVNVVAIVLLIGNWFSSLGFWLWVTSMILLIAAFAAKRSGVRAAVEEPPPDGRSWKIPRFAEAAAVLGMVALAVIMRAWRLGDLRPGMHGDEGEAGTIALAILHGVPTSPFGRGWFFHPNIYFWSVAICMKLFGTGLAGLRSWAVICGVATVVFVYLLAREMFGIRAALLAGFFMAFQSAGALMSRQLSSNAATPAFTVIALYFLVRGLWTRRHVYFASSGLAAGFNAYYFAGGRLTVPTIVIFLGYMAVMHRGFLSSYWTQVAAFVAAVGITAAPLVAYNVVFPLPATTYPNDRFIWLHHADMTAMYGTSSWPAILWDQLQQTLSVFTWAPDASANHILDYPIARPLEAVLIVLGIAWMTWRWKDARFGLLAIWFWVTLIVGGVLTVQAPNVPRLVALLPALPIIMAAWLDHFGGLLQTAIAQARDGVRGRMALWLSAAAVGAVVLVSGVQNWDKYINYYLNTQTQPDVTEQALYVRQTGLGYRYYDLGTPLLYFTHGDNRFINPHADGMDAVNLPSDLPITTNGLHGDKDVMFLVWGPMYDYLPVLRAYYPEGREQVHTYSNPQNLYYYPPLITYRVTHAQIDRRRTVLARFEPARGRAVQRRQPSIGVDRAPPGLTYPVRTTLTGGIVAPQDGLYRFRVSGPAGTVLSIDGSRISTRAVALARGVHDIRLTAPLRDRSSRVQVVWQDGGLPPAPIPRRYIWDNHIGRGWSGVVRQGIREVLERRIDGFLGFRQSQSDPGALQPYTALWSSNLRVTRGGTYRFRLLSNGTSSLRVDGGRVINSPGDGNAHVQKGKVYLAPGVHRLQVSYSWKYGVGYLEVYWTPPGGKTEIMVTTDLSPP